MTCPRCGSDDWKSASLVYQAGTNSTSSKSIGGGITADGDVLFGGVGTSGKHQSELSKLVAPPELEDGLPSAAAGGGCLLVCVGTVLLIWLTRDMAYSDYPSLNFWHPASLILCVIFSIATIASMKNNPEAALKHKKELEEYEQKRVCMRCGSVFQAD